MKKIIIAAAAALFAFAVQAGETPAEKPAVLAAGQAVAKPMTAEECKSAMDACGDNPQCKENLMKQNGCK